MVSGRSIAGRWYIGPHRRDRLRRREHARRIRGLAGLVARLRRVSTWPASSEPEGPGQSHLAATPQGSAAMPSTSANAPAELGPTVDDARMLSRLFGSVSVLAGVFALGHATSALLLANSSIAALSGLHLTLAV